MIILFKYKKRLNNKMIVPIRCFTCGRVMADIADFYESEKEKLKENDNKEVVDKVFKNFEKIHTGEILNKLGLKRYCCRRNLITNIDMMDVI
jgi:DNA-directed RNA polymerase subunit N (RpoN/RPB10)